MLLRATPLLPLLLLTLVPLSVLGDNPHLRKKQGVTDYGDMHRELEHLKQTEGQYNPKIGKLDTDSDEEYYYYTLHDVNEDGYLDGHELYHAFADDYAEEGNVIAHDTLVEWVDHVLEEDDQEQDGRISWAEYLLSQGKRG